MTDEKFASVQKSISKAKSIAVYCHTNPDGDTLCCGLALYFALLSKNKEVEVFCDSEIPSKYAFIDGIDKVSFPEKGVHDLAIAVDASDLDRLGSAMKSFLTAKEQIAIDHHKTHARFADTTVLDVGAAACAEIIFRLLKSMKLLNDTVAKLLFMGIVSDSGCFSYSNTTADTHKIAVELLTYDFDASKAVYDIHKRIDLASFRLKIGALDKCRLYNDNKIAVIVFSDADFEATDTKRSDTEGVISSLIDIDTVEVAYALSQVGKMNYKLSIRTKDNVDASDCAREFGGGGHKNAAGCRVNGYLEDIIEKIVKIASDRL
jgi:phosphoesterase RecJ-like protein